ncbi:hypothetical protein CVT24_009892 [Panaeolus cyanescens]|uniref:Uncharacterized protein n=1 Tax=Panaeolus cyanescens TaxID=181874 RepID=A0A409WU01_9AGAR|nr:hypothetical protein CVT24_009892 [Panaeolus cyanescens]
MKSDNLIVSNNLKKVEFGPNHPIHSKIPWINEQWEYFCPIFIPSGFIRHLESNNPVPVADHNLAIQLKDEILLEIKELKAEQITKLHSPGYKKRKRADRYETLKKTAFVYDVLLSPIRRIPNDILHEIALHLCPTIQPHLGDLETYTAYVSPNSHMPSILERTSKSWRITVHSISSLWQFMRIGYTQWNRAFFDLLTSRVKRFAQLAKSRPLSFQLDDWKRPVDIWEDTIESKKICASYEHCFRLLLSWIFHKWASNRVQKLFFKPFDPSFVLQRIKHYQHQNRIWPHVTTLMILEPDSLGYRRDLRVNSNVAGVFGDEEMPPRTPFIVHKSLVEMILSIPFLQCPPRHILLPFANLQFPNLSRLQLHVHLADLTSPSANAHDRLRPELFMDTFPSLRTLFIDCEASPVKAKEDVTLIFPLLYSVPSIVSLTFTTTQIPQLLLLHKLINDGDTSILPDLRYFNVGISTEFHDRPSTENIGYSTALTTTDINRALPVCGTRLASVKNRLSLVCKSDVDRTRMTALADYLKAECGVEIAFTVSPLVPKRARKGGVRYPCMFDEWSANWYMRDLSLTTYW